MSTFGQFAIAFITDVFDFVKSQIDKIILFTWVIALAMMLVHFTHHHESDAFAWTIRAYDNIQGALLMLLTGRAAQRIADRDKNGNGTETKPKETQ